MKGKLFLLITLAFMVVSCEKETCPEGSYEINDANGNLIDCFTPPDFGQIKKNTDVNLVVLKTKTRFKTSDKGVEIL